MARFKRFLVHAKPNSCAVRHIWRSLPFEIGQKQKAVRARGDARGFRRSTRCVRDRRHQDAGDPRNDEQGEEAATHSEGGSYRGEAPRLARARRTSVRAMSTL